MEAKIIKQNRIYRKHLITLTRVVVQCENAIDQEMKKPSNPNRGKKIARILNVLSMENQVTMRYGLGFSFDKIGKLYENVKPGGKDE